MKKVLVLLLFIAFNSCDTLNFGGDRNICQCDIELTFTDLVFENNTPTGGDMGAHIVAIDTFIKDFMPNLQINGWSNDWFGGYPLYYFYFPLPAIITFILNLVFPFGIAFKIMVVMSTIWLPCPPLGWDIYHPVAISTIRRIYFLSVCNIYPVAIFII